VTFLNGTLEQRLLLKHSLVPWLIILLGMTVAIGAIAAYEPMLAIGFALAVLGEILRGVLQLW
jgi:hypothetical protein